VQCAAVDLLRESQRRFATVLLQSAGSCFNPYHFSREQAGPSGIFRREHSGSCPQAKSAEKRVGIFARATPPRQCADVVDVASSKHRFVRPQGRYEALDDVGHVTPPLLLTVALQAGTSE
jgi:hypothetical protein